MATIKTTSPEPPKAEVDAWVVNMQHLDADRIINFMKGNRRVKFSDLITHEKVIRFTDEKVTLLRNRGFTQGLGPVSVHQIGRHFWGTSYFRTEADARAFVLKKLSTKRENTEASLRRAEVELNTLGKALEMLVS